MSGWSRSTVTILAARRVVPPDLMAPAARSPIFRNDIRPEDRPPPDSDSPSPRRAEKLVPVPEPYLNRSASRTQRSMMPFSRSEEHTSEHQSIMRNSYAVFCLKTKNKNREFLEWYITHITENNDG